MSLSSIFFHSIKKIVIHNSYVTMLNIQKKACQKTEYTEFECNVFIRSQIRCVKIRDV